MNDLKISSVLKIKYIRNTHCLIKNYIYNSLNKIPFDLYIFNGDLTV